MVDSYCLMRAWVLCTLDSGYSQGRRIGCFIKLWSLVAVLSMTQWAGKQWYLTRTAFIHFLLVRTVFPLETTKWAARIKMDHTVGWNSELMTKSDRERWTEVWVLVKSCAPIDPRSTPPTLVAKLEKLYRTSRWNELKISINSMISFQLFSLICFFPDIKGLQDSQRGCMCLM